MERIRQIRDQAQQQAAAQQTGLAPVADRYRPGGYLRRGLRGFGQGSFGQPSAPDPHQPAAASFSSFDTDASQDTQQDRLARLRQLLDRGILTESEFLASGSRSSANPDAGPARTPLRRRSARCCRAIDWGSLVLDSIR